MRTPPHISETAFVSDESERKETSSPLRRESIEETGLLVLDDEFAVNGGHDALNLTHGEHAAQEGVARVVTMS